MDTSSTVKWFKVEHHFKEDLKANMAGKGVRIIALSGVEEIEKVIFIGKERKIYKW